MSEIAKKKLTTNEKYAQVVEKYNKDMEANMQKQQQFNIQKHDIEEQILLLQNKEREKEDDNLRKTFVSSCNLLF